MKWFEIRLKLSTLHKEAVSNRLFELGARGVSDLDQDGESLLIGYFDEKRSDEAMEGIDTYLGSLRQLYPQDRLGQPELGEVADTNWVDLHKEFYKAQPLTDHFYLIPSWDKETRAPEGMVPIRMELGQAFGTGLHGSTQLAMRLLERVAYEIPDLASAACVDVGTGTGILAIAAEKLGFGRIDAFDNDPIAVEVAKDNLKWNDSKRIHLFTGELKQIAGPVEVVVSNILLEVHQQLVEEYQRTVKPGGKLILSGLLTPQIPEVEQLFEGTGFEKEQVLSAQEWTSMGFRRLS